MNTSGFRSSIFNKFNCKNPVIDQRGGNVIVIIMPSHKIAQTKKEIEDLASRFGPIKIQGKNVVIRGEHGEVSECLALLPDLQLAESKSVPKKQRFIKKNHPDFVF